MMFDYEKAPTKYYILVKVSDGKHNVNTTVSVTILNINDNPPQFSQNTYNISVMEDVKTKTIQVILFSKHSIFSFLIPSKWYEKNEINASFYYC